MKLFRVDDGSDYYIAATDHHEARTVWLKACFDSHGCTTEAEVIEGLGEPEITTIQPTEAAAITIMSDVKEDSCPNCGGRGKVPHYDSLLSVAKEGTEPRVLGCSEF